MFAFLGLLQLARGSVRARARRRPPACSGGSRRGPGHFDSPSRSRPGHPSSSSAPNAARTHRTRRTRRTHRNRGRGTMTAAPKQSPEHSALRDLLGELSTEGVNEEYAGFDLLVDRGAARRHAGGERAGRRRRRRRPPRRSPRRSTRSSPDCAAAAGSSTWRGHGRTHGRARRERDPADVRHRPVARGRHHRRRRRAHCARPSRTPKTRPARGAADLEAIGLGPGDALVGISASGRTPYVLGGIEYARRVGALTVGFACNAGSAIGAAADLAIETVVGPEIVAGSTRLKGGTAQKLVLNAISTIAMVRLGKVHGNLMVDVRPRTRSCAPGPSASSCRRPGSMPPRHPRPSPRSTARSRRRSSSP